MMSTMKRLRFAWSAAAPILIPLVGCDDAPPLGFPAGAGGSSSVVSSSIAGVTTGGGEVESAFKSGSRLRARVLDGGGNARSFVGWFDAELGIDCTSAIIAGAAARCLPPRIDTVVYLDDACSEPAAPASQTLAPSYVVEPHAGVQLCDSYRAWSVGAAEVAPIVYSRGPDNVCSAIATDALVQPLSAIPLETFTELDREDELVNQVDWRRVERSADGAYRVVSALLGPTGPTCEVFAGTFESHRACLPNERVRRYPQFSDEACGAAAIGLDACHIAGNAPIVTVDRCVALGVQVNEPGAIVESVFDGRQGGCTPIPATRGRALGPAAPDIYPVDSYPMFLEGPNLVMALEASGDKPVRADGPFLLKSDQGYFGCEVTTTTVGLRCVYPFRPFKDTFADSACTLPAVEIGDVNCLTGLPEYAGLVESDGTLAELHRVGEILPGTVFTDTSGTCKPFASNSTWARVGETLAIDAFPTVDAYVE